MRQVEVSRTIVFTAPRHARGFFEALCADNLDITPPRTDAAHLRSSGPHPTRRRVPHQAAAFRDEVTLNAHFRHSRVKSYLKCGRAFRIETVVNDTGDLGVARRIEHLPEILSKARDVNSSHGRCFPCRPGLCPCEPSL